MLETLNCVIVGQNWKGVRVIKKRKARCVLNNVASSCESDEEPEPDDRHTDEDSD